MLILLVSHPLLRKLCESVVSIWGRSNGSSIVNKADMELTRVNNAEADVRSNQRITFDVYFAALFISVLHGFSALKVFAILYMNYNLAKRLPRAYLPAATWIFSVGILLTNELCRGYPFGPIFDSLLPWSASLRDTSVNNHQLDWGDFLDSYGGLIPRWEVLFKFTILRMISFNFDFYWNNNRPGESLLEVCFSKT